jgi:hypothetical protein
VAAVDGEMRELMALTSLREGILRGSDPAAVKEFRDLSAQMGEQTALELLRSPGKR